MAELKLSGNHLKGSRPVLTFHKARLATKLIRYLHFTCFRDVFYGASPLQLTIYMYSAKSILRAANLTHTLFFKGHKARL